ncbi:hypothetical protein TrRE_jg12955 [Triparma retinervis]|uniref:Uncharacterized protein n=1 Tax=Triparma retinervis TaxID=2557542 RepID=A0A9W7DUS5_9STRA|nr:hypothetical protein TrRE_jg12955 [Triparma retinervis]
MSPVRDAALGVQEEEECPAVEEGGGKADAMEGVAEDFEERLARSEDLVGDLRRQLALSSEHCKKLSVSLSSAEALASEVPQLKASLKETIGTLKDELTGKDAEIGTLKDELTGKDAEIGTLKDELTGKDAEIVTLKDELTCKYAEIEALKDNLISKDAEILTLNDNLISKDAEVLTLAADLKTAKLVEPPQITTPPPTPDHALHEALHEREVEDLKATIKEVEFNAEQTIESFREEILRLNAEAEERECAIIEERESAIEDNKRIIETLRSEAAPPPTDDSTYTARIQELEEELATLTDHATAADEWMQSANENFEKVCSDKEELERLCNERASQVEELVSDKNGLQERVRGLEMSVESMMNEKAATPRPPSPQPPAPSAPLTATQTELFEKLSVSEKQRASVLADLAEEKERSAAKLSALAEEVRTELKRIRGLKQ